MCEMGSKEYVCVLVMDELQKVFLTNFKDRGLWLPFEERSDLLTLRGLAQKVVEKVCVERVCQALFANYINSYL